MPSSTANLIITLGIILVVIGVIFSFGGDKLSWIGNLPGDINIKGKNTRVFIPITTMILLSVIVTIVTWLVRYLKSMM